MGEPCVERQWYLVGAAEPGRRLLHIACNDGYGARGMGEDRVEIRQGTAQKPGRLVATRSGGSSWGWSSTDVVSLDPLEVVSSRTSSWWTLGPQLSERTLDRARGVRRVKWEHGSCGGGEAGPGSGDLSGAYTVIPEVPPGLGGAFEELDISRCAAPIAGPSASMSVLARGPQELLVQITDDHWVDEAESWLFEDHLEVWIGEELPNTFDNGCVGAPTKPSQWAIRLPVSSGQCVVDGQALVWKAAASRPDGPVTSF